MRQIHHSLVCLPRVPPLLIEFHSQTTTLHSICIAQDEAPCVGDFCGPRPLAAAQGSISDRSGIIGSPPFYLGVHARLQGHLRRHVFQQILVHRRTGHVPIARDKPDGKRNVPVPRVGAQRRSYHSQRVRGDDSQGLCRSRALPYLHPAVDEEVHAAAHCQSLRGLVEYESIAIVRAAVSIAAQTHLPSSSKSFGGVHDSPHHPRYAITLVFTLDVPSVIGISTHPTRPRGPHCQNRVGLVIARSRQGRGHSYRSCKIQDVRFRFARRVVTHPYCNSRYSPRIVVLMTIPTIVYSPPSPLSQVAHQIFKDLSIPYPARALGVDDMECRWRRTLFCFISHWASLHTHVVSIAAYKPFFVGICTS